MTDKLPDSHDGRNATEPLGLRLSEELCVTQRRSPADIVAEALDRENFPAGADSADGWTRMYRVGKKSAGRLLDGRTWDEVPG